MKVAIIGSKYFEDKPLVNTILQKELIEINAEVITGGARGVDSWVVDFCKKDATPCEVIRPINRANKIDYLFRDIEIITKADRIIAFWDGSSKRTKFVIDYANARNKEIIVYTNSNRK